MPEKIINARNDILVSEGGREIIDMFSAHGTTLLGHGNPAVTSVLSPYVEGLWASGGLETPIHVEATALIESFFPPSHRLAMMYSTGMESGEFAIRIARVSRGTNGVIGFARSMHGKSLATSFLGWDNGDGVQLPDFCRLPFIQNCSEEEILDQVRQVLERGTTSAVFVEPLQGSGGGFAASHAFYRDLYESCREHDVVLVFDEMLTGFFRTGQPFYFSDLGFVPDIVLVGKAMGNGFPVSAVLAHERYAIEKTMLPGSTFSGNPLASAAITGTLRQMKTMDLPSVVAQIESTILANLEPIRDAGITPRGKGALWVLEIPQELNAQKIAAKLLERGVFVSSAGPFIRLMPAATIEPTRLSEACSVVREELLEACEGARQE